MNEMEKYEWRMMVQSAELSLKSTCPLLEDEIIVEVNKRIAELEKTNTFLQEDLNALVAKHGSLHTKFIELEQGYD